jgi:CDGSH-type Zn-finger protein/uncharacterized Fe-S cluster protein YjdI
MSDGVDEIRGKKVLIRFEGGKCIHSRGCVLGRPDVFVPNVEGDWIHPDAASPEDVAKLAENCPSGAIAYERLDGGPNEQAPKVNTARVLENGPIALRGELSIQGKRAFRATLCRCGASKNKPYCDTSHHEASFEATGEPKTTESSALPVRDGVLEVATAKNGPLLLTGSVEVISGTGRTIHRVQKCALCRCGGSKNKPFCDGTHTKIGFTAD